MNIAILASGHGTTLQAIIDACRDRSLDARVAVVISNNSASPAMQRAAAAGIPTVHLSRVTHPDDEARDLAMAEALANHRADLVVTAGYLKKLGHHTLTRYHRRIINVHPSLLPRHGGDGMFGENVHAAVIAAGDTESGATVHHVDADYDTGEIISQARIDVVAGDTPATLAERLRPVEHRLLLSVIAAWPTSNNHPGETPWQKSTEAHARR